MTTIEILKKELIVISDDLKASLIRKQRLEKQLDQLILDAKARNDECLDVMAERDNLKEIITRALKAGCMNDGQDAHEILNEGLNNE